MHTDILFCIYLHTGIDYVTLGGVRQYENYNNGLDENDSRGIWQKVLRINSQKGDSNRSRRNS